LTRSDGLLEAITGYAPGVSIHFRAPAANPSEACRQPDGNLWEHWVAKGHVKRVEGPYARKDCFNFKTYDETLFAELDPLTSQTIAAFRSLDL